MPTWHVFDEETASALRDQNVDGSVAFAGASADLLLNTDAVVIAPTKCHGEVFLLTARHRVTEAPIFTPAAPPESQIYVEAAETPTLKPAVQAVEDAIQPDIVDEPEQYFGPTTWERLDQIAVEDNDVPEDALGDGEYGGQSEQAGMPQAHEPPNVETIVPERQPLPASPDKRKEVQPRYRREEPAPIVESVDTSKPAADTERQYVATGFLGLDDYAEDEEEIKRAKLPWWKKLFTD